jgi:hypothetical protein
VFVVLIHFGRITTIGQQSFRLSLRWLLIYGLNETGWSDGCWPALCSARQPIGWRISTPSSPMLRAGEGW